MIQKLQPVIPFCYFHLDAVWSEFNEVHRQGIAKKMGWNWVWFFFDSVLLYIFFSGYCLVVIHYSWLFQGDHPRYGSLAQVQVYAISQCFFVIGLMMKPAWMLSQAGFLRKAPLSAEALDFSWNVRIKQFYSSFKLIYKAWFHVRNILFLKVYCRRPTTILGFCDTLERWNMWITSLSELKHLLNSISTSTASM